MAISNTIFDEYVAAYLSAISEVDYDGLAALQGPPFGCLSNGGAGIAYMLRRSGDARRARAWAEAAVRDCRAGAFQGRARAIDPSAYLIGRGGVLVARALDRRAAPRAANAYAALVRRAPRVRAELIEGMAGLLVGATIILRQVEHAGVRRAGGQLADDIARPPRAAQGEARLGRERRDRLRARLGRRALRAPRVEPRVGRGRADPRDRRAARAPPRVGWRAIAPAMRASWCAGAAGAAMLWSHAYDCTGERAFLVGARRAARAADGAVAPAHRHLCCGAGGVAYALLALHRVDPDGGLARARARGRRDRDALDDAVLRRPNGLVWPVGAHEELATLAIEARGDPEMGDRGVVEIAQHGSIGCFLHRLVVVGALPRGGLGLVTGSAGLAPDECGRRRIRSRGRRR